MSAATRAGRTYRGQSAAERSSARRAAIIEAGLELFGHQRFAEVSVADVVRVSGQTRRAFYEQFKDLEALVAAVDRECVRDPLVQRLAAVDLADDWNSWQALLGEILGFYTEDPRRPHVAFVAVVGVSATLEAYRHETSRPLVSGVAQLFGERAGPTDEERHVAASAFLGAFSTLLIAAQRDERFTPDRVRVELERILRARFFS